MPTIAAALLGGCGELKVRSGVPVAPALLESDLTVGRSTAEDVRRVLGEPVGVGREFMPQRGEVRTVWSYNFEEGQISLAGSGDSRRIFVWVFLDGTRYDGYLWVSSFPQDRPAD
ncbi:MAG: hypothetical protein LPJ94_03800 [Thauera sp.]|nr:hypothetical protein [Thauera sp.]